MSAEHYGDFRVINASRVVPIVSEDALKDLFGAEEAQKCIVEGTPRDKHGLPLRRRRFSPRDCVEMVEDGGIIEESLLRAVRELRDPGFSDQAYIIRSPEGSFLIEPKKDPKRD